MVRKFDECIKRLRKLHTSEAFSMCSLWITSYFGVKFSPEPHSHLASLPRAPRLSEIRYPQLCYLLPLAKKWKTKTKTNQFFNVSFQFMVLAILNLKMCANIWLLPIFLLHFFLFFQAFSSSMVFLFRCATIATIIEHFCHSSPTDSLDPFAVTLLPLLPPCPPALNDHESFCVYRSADSGLFI